jgi:hypothetical protein
LDAGGINTTVLGAFATGRGISWVNARAEWESLKSQIRELYRESERHVYI